MRPCSGDRAFRSTNQHVNRLWNEELIHFFGLDFFSLLTKSSVPEICLSTKSFVTEIWLSFFLSFFLSVVVIVVSPDIIPSG